MTKILIQKYPKTVFLTRFLRLFFNTYLTFQPLCLPVVAHKMIQIHNVNKLLQIF